MYPSEHPQTSHMSLRSGDATGHERLVVGAHSPVAGGDARWHACERREQGGDVGKRLCPMNQEGAGTILFMGQTVGPMIGSEWRFLFCTTPFLNQFPIGKLLAAG